MHVNQFDHIQQITEDVGDKDLFWNLWEYVGSSYYFAPEPWIGGFQVTETKCISNGLLQRWEDKVLFYHHGHHKGLSSVDELSKIQDVNIEPNCEIFDKLEPNFPVFQYFPTDKREECLGAAYSQDTNNMKTSKTINCTNIMFGGVKSHIDLIFEIYRLIKKGSYSSCFNLNQGQ